MIIFGEMGNGKSTAGNEIAKELVRQKGGSWKKNMGFEAGKSSQAVTTQLTMKEFEGVNIMDTPGFNDPNPERTDQIIMSDTIESIQKNKTVFNDGIACLL
jgi:putative ribosome biogenesis GTPase RsgA